MQTLQQCPEVASLSLTELLKGFFEFYGLFDYQNNGICVISGKEIRRRRIDAILDVVNPMEPNLNTSVFVQEEALMKFRRLCHQACRKLQYLDSLQVKILYFCFQGFKNQITTKF